MLKTTLKHVKIALGGALILIFFVAYLFPVIWMVLSSLKTQSDAYAIPPKWVFWPTFMNYREILFNRNLVNYAGNSLIIASFTTIITLFIATFAAYSLSRYRNTYSRDLAFFILSTRMAPPVMVVLPIYLMFRDFLHLYNTYPGLILAHVAFNLPLAVWLLRGFMLDIPLQLDEAARIDGANRWTILWKVIFPLTRPGLAASGILCFIFSWNEFFFSLVLTGRKTRTLPVTVTSFVSGMGIEWGELNAAGTIIMIPLLIFAIAMQKYLIQGLTLGALKE
jgi:multiple sugar transport system permease protein